MYAGWCGVVYMKVWHMQNMTTESAQTQIARQYVVVEDIRISSLGGSSSRICGEGKGSSL
jgi:hypothetical protein